MKKITRENIQDYALKLMFKMKEEEFHAQFNRLFKYEEKKEDVSLKKIRQLLVLHKIPIKYCNDLKVSLLLTLITIEEIAFK